MLQADRIITEVKLKQQDSWKPENWIKQIPINNAVEFFLSNQSLTLNYLMKRTKGVFDFIYGQEITIGMDNSYSNEDVFYFFCEKS